MARIDDQTLSLGFDAGNYSAAYDGLSLAAGLDKARHEGRLAMSEADVDSDAFAAAFTLGYLSALEDDEMGDDADAFLEALESEAGRRVVELGYIEYIDRKSDAAQ